MKDKLISFLFAFCAVLAGAMVLTAVVFVAATATALAKYATSFSDIPSVLDNLSQNAHLALDLLQELSNELPLGRPAGYLLDVLLQNQIADPFSSAGFQNLFSEAIAVASLTNLLSLVLRPQSVFSIMGMKKAFEYSASLMVVVNSALAVIVITLLGRVFTHPAWFWFAAILAFVLEIVVLRLQIKVLSLVRISVHVLRTDIIGFLLKQLVFSHFLGVMIHITRTGAPDSVWEYLVCLLLTIGTVPLLEWIEHLCD